MAAKKVEKLEFSRGEFVFLRGDVVPAGWKHIAEYDDALVALDSFGDSDDPDRPRPTYKEIGIKVITKI